MNLADLTIAEAGRGLRSGAIGAVALTEAHLARIAERDPHYRAFVTVTGEAALADAVRADAELAAGQDRGPLHGIPVALKDLIDTAGVRTSCGSRLRAGHAPTEDARVVKGLRMAGAVLIGKVATYEFALVGPSFDLPFAPARNPWNTDHITGGSSSGSAAAVAGGLVRTAIGTDTGGSIRSPACYCGIVGLKPTRERLSREGVFPLSPSLDHVGPLSASVEEAALTLDALSDAGAATRLGETLDGKRIGYARDWFAADPHTHPAALRALDDAASTLSLLGARIEEVQLPDYALFEAVGAVIIQAEALEVHAEWLARRPEEYGALAYRNLLTGLVLEPTDVVAAHAMAGELTRRIDTEMFGPFDALLTINTLGPALPLSAFDGVTSVWTHMRTLPFNVTGHPVLALPAGFVDGLPLGLQLIGRRGDEAGLCAIGDAFERATDHSAQHPPLPRAG